MPSFLERFKPFADAISIELGGVQTLEFLEASQAIVKAFDHFSMTAYAVIKNDVQTNIDKIKLRYDAFPQESVTLEKLVEHEKTEENRVAMQGLLWLLRSLSFTHKTLERAQANPQEELTKSCTKAYNATLEPHHNFVVKATFQVAMKACPYRADFYRKLADDDGIQLSQEKLNEQLNNWLHGLGRVVEQLEAFYKDNGYDTGPSQSTANP